MSVSIIDIQEEAVRLCDDADNEAKYRNAISRTYYSLYHTTFCYAESRYTPPPSAIAGPTHAKLSNMLAQDMEKSVQRRLKIRKVGISLRTLHERRCDADYHLNLSFTKDDVVAHRNACLARIAELEALAIEEPAA